MKIFVMRHGQAAVIADSDKNRPLTKLGGEEATLSAHWLESYGHEFDTILISPYLRAQQTANVVQSIVKYAKCQTLDFITPSGSARDLHDYVDGVLCSTENKKVLFVSHMPLVSSVVAELTNESTLLSFDTAMIVEIDYDTQKMKGHFVQAFSPKVSA